MPKQLSMWVSHFCNKAKIIYPHKKIIEKRCQKPLVKILSQLWYVKLISHCYKFTPYATDKHKFPETLQDMVDIPDYINSYPTVYRLIIHQWEK